MFKNIVRSSMVVLALGFAACDDVPTTTNTPDDVSETEFDPSFDVSLPPDGGTCPEVFYEESKLLSNGITVTWTKVLAGFEYTEGEDYVADVNWSVDQGSANYVGFTPRSGPNTWTPRRDVDGMMSPGAASDGTVPVTVSMMSMHEAAEGSADDDDDEDDEDEEDESAWAGKIGNGHFWLRLEIEDADGKVKRVKLGVNFHLEDPADGYGSNCPGDDGPVDPPVGNEPPVADAGDDQTVEDTDDNGGEDIALDGSGSMDPDGTIVSWSWSEGGSEIATGEMPTQAFAVGVHEVTLTVTDDDGDTDTDAVVITVEAAPGANQPPVADAGDDQTVEDTDGSGGEDIGLDGSASMDPDGTIVSWSWSEGGSEIATGETPTVAFAVGVHEVTLTVTDDAGDTDTDQVVITVEAAPPPGNEPPVADAGPNQTVEDTDDNGSEDVALDGSASMDPDGTIVSWSWSEGGSEIATGETPTVAFAVGVHEVTLTVTDDAGDTDTDQVVITVEAAPPPGVSYAADIQPYFNSNCTGCHGSGTARAGVRLDSWANVRAGADDGTPLVVPGNSNDASAILLPQMRDGHQGAPHGTSIIQQIANWIDAGAENN